MVESLLVAILSGAVIAIPILGMMMRGNSDVRAELRREIQGSMRDLSSVGSNLRENFTGVEREISDTRKEIVAVKREIEELRIEIRRIQDMVLSAPAQRVTMPPAAKAPPAAPATPASPKAASG
ncbi:MAG: hypothetical protein FJX47_05565 [Alphaproteobacteria bacterium]|nr:hypothetical protein [Alphaproteobacteria bacterium]